MSLEFVEGIDLVRSIKAGCIKLEHNKDRVDQLNVFPVPDGDTGTNMYLTLMSAVKEGEKNQDQALGKVAKAISKGALMGARGNSGVILSQIFRGIARELEGKEKAGSMDLARAFKNGSDTAYEAVMKPVEGTILTVIREVARACEKEASHNKDIIAMLLSGINAGARTLKKTPDMLPVLKEAGVVDSGGQGLVYFLEGFMEGFALENEIPLDTYRQDMAPETVEAMAVRLEALEYQYCTELLIKGNDLNPEEIKEHLNPLGDSMLVVGGDDLVKVHIHVNHPGKVLESCLQWGQLSDIKINNMLEEVHEHRLNLEDEQKQKAAKKIGLVAVASGAGVIDILKSLGVDEVVEGGQTMNPSTEDLLSAAEKVNSPAVIIFPNNSNIIMAAQQLDSLTEKKIAVVPTLSVMQAITALVAYDPEGDIDSILSEMTEEIKQVKFAEITYAVRDSAMNGLDIKEGDKIGILAGEITATGDEENEIAQKLLEQMVDEDSELITLFYGNGLREEEAMALKEIIEESFPEHEVEMHWGGQPHYSYFISVE
ncbi:MAG: DAK2 domain-containing protein [Syntrophomonadaceae bacterium]|nr:DAK2 domain-containing protein [Syntrophomonadaceae bacterium]